jgi:hypothetical protein
MREKTQREKEKKKEKIHPDINSERLRNRE